MKIIFLSSIVVSVFLSQASFAATQTPPVTDPTYLAFIQHQDQESNTFFQGQVQERLAFQQAHTDIITKQDKYGKDLMAWKDAQDHKGNWTGGPPNRTTTQSDENVVSGFTQKQLADKNAFLAKLAQEKQQFLSSHPGL